MANNELIPNPIRLSYGVLTDTPQEMYSVQNQFYVIIKEILICNTDTVDRTYTMNIVPSGDSVSIDNKFISEANIQASETKIISLSTILEQGDKIYLNSNISDKLTYYISGVKVKRNV